MEDIRWIQRFNNYKKAFGQLRDAVELSESRELSVLEKQGLIQAFEYTHELAWKTLKDFLLSRGVQNIYGSKDATKEAFGLNIISDGETWMAMITSRNETSHTYDEERVNAIVESVIHRYFDAFEQLLKKLETLQNEEQ